MLALSCAAQLAGGRIDSRRDQLAGLVAMVAGTLIAEVSAGPSNGHARHLLRCASTAPCLTRRGGRYRTIGADTALAVSACPGEELASGTDRPSGERASWVA